MGGSKAPQHVLLLDFREVFKNSPMDAENSHTPTFSAMLIDDDEDTRNIFEHLLGYYGVKTSTFHCGNAAFDYLERNAPPDIILIDLHLPNPDGYTLARQFRTSALNIRSRLVATTEYHTSVTVGCSILSKFDAYLAKPLPHQLYLYLLGLVEVSNSV